MVVQVCLETIIEWQFRSGLPGKHYRSEGEVLRSFCFVIIRVESLVASLCNNRSITAGKRSHSRVPHLVITVWHNVLVSGSQSPGLLIIILI